MHCRLVATMALIAATGLQAADELNLNTGRSHLRLTVATNELHVEGARSNSGPLAAKAEEARTQIVVAGGRAATSATARVLLATGEATRADPVLYLHGRVSPESRVIATRRVLLQAAAGEDPAALAAAHGLRLTKPSRAQADWWIAEPISNDLYAAIDAAASLSADKRAALAMPILQMPVRTNYVPTDPVFREGTPPYQWHLSDTFPGIRISEVWDNYKGHGTNVAITDTGMQVAHPDLSPNVKLPLSYDYKDDDTNPNPTGPGNEDHSTAVAGVAAAAGDNWPTPLGVVGVAFKSGIIANRVLANYDRNNPGLGTLAADDRMYDAMMAQAAAGRSSDLTWANNNSWGAGDSTLVPLDILPLIFAGMRDATAFGRGGRGIPIIFACGNSGTPDPNEPQHTSAFNVYLNRYTIGVAALSISSPLFPAFKASYSSTGPNITISAPGGDNARADNGDPAGGPIGITTTDRTGDQGYIVDDPLPLPPPSDFNLDRVVVTTPPTQDPPATPHPPALPYENGDYVPPTYRLAGTSFAAPVVTGGVALMLQSRPQLSWRDIRQIMIHRGQDQIGDLPSHQGAVNLHSDWSYWRPNGANLRYNNWYGFGGMDMGRFVFGGTGTSANTTAVTALDEPGSLRWPLLPPLQETPLTYNATFPYPVAGDTSDPVGLTDAPAVLPAARNLVPDGRPTVGNGTRRVNVALPISTAPARFRVDTVEVYVKLTGVGASTYPASVVPQGSPTGTFDWTQYEYRLRSPSGATCILGRQFLEYQTGENVSEFEWTFTEIFHTNESQVAGTWTLSIIDETDSLIGSINTEARVAAAGIKIYGHQTYPTPDLNGTSTSGLPSGLGDQTIEVRGSDFGISEGNVGVVQAYWYPDDLTTTPVELPTTYIDDSRAKVRIPASLLPTSSPGQGYVTIANPAIVIGRTGTGPGDTDLFDNPSPITPMPSTSSTNPSRYMKRCDDGDARRIKYSRPPTLTPIADIEVEKKGTVIVTTIADDPDVAAGLPLASPEILTLSAISFNPNMVGDPTPVQITPTADGLGTYRIEIPVLNGDSAFAIIQVSVTDGVTTTVRSFRIINPTELEATGCGGGMGLALLGIPLGVWLLRRKRR